MVALAQGQSCIRIMAHILLNLHLLLKTTSLVDKEENTKTIHSHSSFCLLAFLLILSLAGCDAAPAFDLAAGEIAAAEGLTLHMPQAELPDPWTDTAPSLADIEYAGLDFAAEANFADGELTSLSASCEEASREDVDALLAAFETDCEAGGVRALDVRYAVVTDAQDWFTLRVDATLAAGSSEEISRFYHIDKRSGARVQLSDLFPEGTDYVTALSDEVRSQMTARAEAGEDFFPEAFDAIDANQNFYWGADGALVLVFDEYTIASGSMGMPEFSIPASMVEALQNG